MDVRPMYPGDRYAGGVVTELLPDRRCGVRLNDGRAVIGRIPVFCNRFTDWYYPEPGHEVTVYLEEYADLGGEYLLVGFPRLEAGKLERLDGEP